MSEQTPAHDRPERIERCADPIGCHAPCHDEDGVLYCEVCGRYEGCRRPGQTPSMKAAALNVRPAAAAGVEAVTEEMHASAMRTVFKLLSTFSCKLPYTIGEVVQETLTAALVAKAQPKGVAVPEELRKLYGEWKDESDRLDVENKRLGSGELIRLASSFSRMCTEWVIPLIVASPAQPATGEDALAAKDAENTRLRAALAQSTAPCAYCTLSQEDWAKCQHGFPGCARADDAMGCPELGARMEVEQIKADLAQARANEGRMREALTRAVSWHERAKMQSQYHWEYAEHKIEEEFFCAALQGAGSGAGWETEAKP